MHDYDIERIRRWIIEGESCHYWRGVGNSDNRPKTLAWGPDGNRKPRRVARVLLEHRLGRYLESWEHALHSCNNGDECVNIDHLRVGTHSENMYDQWRAGRMTAHGWFKNGAD